MWWQAVKHTKRPITWDAFGHALKEEFGPDEFAVQMHQHLQLRQLGTVVDYRLQFDKFMYQQLAFDPSLSTKFFVTQFVLGLKQELRAFVRAQSLASITRAMLVARIQEEELD